MSIKGIVVAVLSSFVLSACISAKSFVDPTQPKASYEELTKRPELLKLKLAVEFQRNGQPYPRVDTILKDNVERVLRATGLIVPVDSAGDGEIKVTLNNIADIGGAAAKGFGTGLTFGLAGTTVMDAYEMSISISMGGKTVTKNEIKHALYTAIGNTTLPEGVEVFPMNVAFGRVVEQMIIRALHEMQKSGDLAYKPTSMTWNMIAHS